MLKCLRVIKCKMNAVVAIALFSVFLGVCECTNVQNATLTMLPEAVKTGAVCLDGSPPGYYLRKAPKGGVSQNKWILHLGGGGWCGNITACYNRSKTNLGSSKSWQASTELNGFLSDVKSINPSFYDWNIIYLMYCDGSSFTSDVDTPGEYNNTKLYYRGLKILDVLIRDILKKGMSHASDVILTGCSAGGLAAYLHADAVKTYLPMTTKYRVFPDAGYFLDIPTVSGDFLFRSYIQNAYKLFNISMGVNQDCLRDKKLGWPCFFAPYTYQYIKSPLFVVNSLYDTAQLAGIYELPCFPPKCDKSQIQELDNFGSLFREQAGAVMQSNSTINGYFFDSCLVHCQTLFDDTWTTYKVNKQSIADTFAAWYYGSNNLKLSTKVKDCPYPCNQSCPKKHNPLKAVSEYGTYPERKFAL